MKRLLLLLPVVAACSGHHATPTPRVSASPVTCTSALRGRYDPTAAVRLAVHGAAVERAIAGACLSEVQLSESMGVVGDGVVYNGDERELAAQLCRDLPKAALCRSGRSPSP